MIPTFITAETTDSFLVSLADYPAPTYSATITIINASHKLTLTGTNSGGDHLFTLAATDILNSKAGNYSYQLQVSKTGFNAMVQSGTIVIKKNFATASAEDFRSHAKKMVDALEAAILGTADQLVMNTEIGTSAGSRKLGLMSATDRLKWYNYWKSIVQQEERQAKIDAGLSPGGKYYVRFN
jgi:hypothetical protein